MIAFLGTGLLGANFTRALLQKSEEMHVWNRTAGKAKGLEAYGAKSFVDVAEAVNGASLIHLTLSDDQAVNEVLAKAAPGFQQDAIIIDHTTTSAAGALMRANNWKLKGFSYIHAPVFMGPPNALESTGTMLVSGDQEVIKILEPHLSKMTGKLWNLGEQPDKAAAIKLLGNLFHIGLVGVISDMISLAGTYHIPSDELASLLELLNPAQVAQGRLKRITSNSFDQPSWELAMARKDASLMMEQATGSHKQLFVIPAVAQKMDQWLAKGKANSDWTIISKEVK